MVVQSLCSNIRLYQSMRLLHQFNCVGIDVKIAAEWSGFTSDVLCPLAIVSALNLKYKSKPSPDAK